MAGMFSGLVWFEEHVLLCLKQLNCLIEPLESRKIRFDLLLRSLR